MLQLYNILLTLLHTVLIFFNLFAWIWQPLRRAHLVCVGLTAASWFILGIWYGIGYCPFTDWQWRVKEQLGETNLPNSFIKYCADKIFNADISSSLIDMITLIGFLLAVILTVYVNFFIKNKESRQN